MARSITLAADHREDTRVEPWTKSRMSSPTWMRPRGTPSQSGIVRRTVSWCLSHLTAFSREFVPVYVIIGAVGMDESPRNQASDRACEAFPLLGDRQFMKAVQENPVGFFSPNVVREDRRRLVGAPTTRTAAEFIEQLETWFNLSNTPPIFSVVEVVAVRGELSALVRCRVSYGTRVQSSSMSCETTPTVKRRGPCCSTPTT